MVQRHHERLTRENNTKFDLPKCFVRLAHRTISPYHCDHRKHDQNRTARRRPIGKSTGNFFDLLCNRWVDRLPNRIDIPSPQILFSADHQRGDSINPMRLGLDNSLFHQPPNFGLLAIRAELIWVQVSTRGGKAAI